MSLKGNGSGSIKQVRRNTLSWSFHLSSFSLGDLQIVVQFCLFVKSFPCDVHMLSIFSPARSMKILHCTVPKIRSEFLHRKSVYCTNAKCYWLYNVGFYLNMDFLLNKTNNVVPISEKKRSHPCWYSDQHWHYECDGCCFYC